LLFVFGLQAALDLSTDAASAVMTAPAAAAGAMQHPGTSAATAAGAAASTCDSATRSLSTADVIAMLQPLDQQQLTTDAAILLLLLSDRTGVPALLQPSSMPIGDLLIPTYLADVLKDMVIAAGLHSQDLSLAAQFVITLRRVLKLPGVAAALGPYTVDGIYGINQLTHNIQFLQRPPAPVADTVVAAVAAEVWAAAAAISAGHYGAGAGGQQQAAQGMDAGQQTGQQQQQEEEGQDAGNVSTGAVGQGKAQLFTFFNLRAATRLRCLQDWQVSPMVWRYLDCHVWHCDAQLILPFKSAEALGLIAH
jgi:hypothetical protein